MTERPRPALLISGGIGDFLHCLTLVDSFLAASRMHPRDISVFIESTRPAEVQSLFVACMSEFDVHYLPGNLHWTKTNPLLDPYSEEDRSHRPTRLLLTERGIDVLEDWFLPFLATGYARSTRRLESHFTKDSGPPGPIVVATRDKGFPWWLSDAAVDVVRSWVADPVELGSDDEILGKFGSRVVSPSTLEALTVAYNARLLIGTDTGLATLRELLGLPNVYCVSAFWKERFMARFGYWNAELDTRSPSRFAFDLQDLDAALEHFSSIVSFRH